MKISSNHPNIIMIVMDSARSDMFGCYGNKYNLTPNIDKLAKDSVVCKNFYAAGSGSALSHTSLFSGQHACRTGVVHNLSEIKKDIPSITKTLKNNNYVNFGKSQIICPPVGYEELFGFDELVYPQTSKNSNDKISFKKKILDNLRKYPKIWTFLKIVFSKTFGTRILLEQTAKHFNGRSSLNYILEKINTYKNNCFAYSTIFHPHTPYCPPKWVMEKLFPNKKINEKAYSIQTDFHAWLNGNYKKDQKIIEDLKTLYMGELFYGDHLIGELIDNLKKKKIYDDTLILITGDHGEFFDEHGQLNHGGTVFNEVIKVPCIIKFPKNYKAGTSISKITSHFDIFPTIINYLNIKDNNLQMDGEDIFIPNKNRFIVVDAPPLVLPGRLSHYPKVVLDQSYFWRSIINLEYKYIWKSDGKNYLYKTNDYENEKNNILANNNNLAKNMHQQMINFYKKINSEFDINKYPINIGKTAAKFITSPRIIRELKKEGFL